MRVSYAILKQVEPDPSSDWTTVQMQTKGQVGYMKNSLVWSPVGYRLAISKTGDQWRIQALLAGD